MRTLVLGVGNPLMSDDGVGVRVLEELSRRQPALDEVDYLDAGTLGLVLLSQVEQAQALLVIDAAQLGLAPGETNVLHGADMDAFFRNARGSVHEVGIRDLLDAARLMGALPSRRAFVGVQPQRVAIGSSLSPSLHSSIVTATAHARAILEAWQLDFTSD
jgi:hydrogenase maturation protease